MPIFMTHEKHGATNVYTEADAVSHEKNGWKRDSWGNKESVDDRQTLINEAEEKGVFVDKRWNISKLKAALSGNRE